MSTNEEADFMEELRKEFKETIAKNILEFPALYKEAKYADIAKIAHDIKGTAGVFELEKGAKIAAALQQSAQDKEVEKTRALIDALIAYMKEAGIVDKN
ncbi:MAG: Hpt domain-containing protein [Candidatus Aminicenantes bacterium]|nr:Hpt domain-containing protein [Candidatus Aminicenantes bacterium]